LALDLPPLSVIVPTRNRVDLLRTCLNGVADADYPQMEVIVVDNDSDDPETLAFLAALDPAQHRVLRYGGTFNYSAINNHAAAQAQGRLLCLLNNDIEMIDPHWLAIMATQASRPDVGAVGARLLYPDGRIQHAGVVIGVGSAAGHAHRLLRADEEGYFHRHGLPQFTSAVTAACLVVEREKFMAVGGLNERDFAVAFNDVDLCLRLNQQGWQSLYEPRATLIHHESVSRGLDRDPIGAARFAGELAALKRLWATDEIYDPYHHPELSRASEQFVVRL
jgi:GT2 family glycosyltransferase